MHVIRMKNCAFFARHGLLDAEEALGQRFYVDVEMTVDADGDLLQDRIDATVDYGVAFGVIEEIITGRRRFLIEALAMEVAQALCNRFHLISRAVVTVRKPNAPVPGVMDHVEATVAWPR
jgi:dihydroneopterin aldolase